MNHNQAHHDYCFANANGQSINPRNDLKRVEAEQRSRRVKRISCPIIRRSLLEFEKSGKQMCSIPCQKQPLLVDKKKILDFIGLKWLANQIPERLYIFLIHKVQIWRTLVLDDLIFVTFLWSTKEKSIGWYREVPWELPKKWCNKFNGEIFGWKFNNPGCFFSLRDFQSLLDMNFLPIVYIISFQNRKSCSVTKYGSLWINVSLKNGNKLIQKALEVRGMTIENCICALSQFCD